jgi:hypothetical protein
MGFVFFAFLLFGFCFVVGIIFRLSSSFKSFYHQESSHYLQIKHNRNFLLQRERLHHNLGFTSSCYNLGKIAKEEEKIKINRNKQFFLKNAL